MSAEAKADALENFLTSKLVATDSHGGGGGSRPPPWRSSKRRSPRAVIVRGAGKLFAAEQNNVAKLPPMPEKPTLTDFIRLRFSGARPSIACRARVSPARRMRMRKWCSPA